MATDTKSAFTDKLEIWALNHLDLLFAIARWVKPVLVFKNFVLVTRFEHIQEVLNRVVAIRLVGDYFGIPGWDETEFVEAASSMFQYLFRPIYQSGANTQNSQGASEAPRVTARTRRRRPDAKRGTIPGAYSGGIRRLNEPRKTGFANHSKPFLPRELLFGLR